MSGISIDKILLFYWYYIEVPVLPYKPNCNRLLQKIVILDQIFSSFVSEVAITKVIFKPNTVNLSVETKRNYCICFEHFHIVIEDIGCNSNLASFEDNPRHSASVFLVIWTGYWKLIQFCLKAPTNIRPKSTKTIMGWLASLDQIQQVWAIA